MFQACKKWEQTWGSGAAPGSGLGVLAYGSATENSYQGELIFSQEQYPAPG